MMRISLLRKPDPVAAWLTGLTIAFITLAVYRPALDAGFVDYDDPLYVTENTWVLEGLNADTFKAAWTRPVAGNWHPVTMLSHLLDVTMFGAEPRGHHATSLLLHTANALLLFILLRHLFGGWARPGVAALVFALHPFNTDSAVWVSERKNLLSTLFWLGATILYVRYVQKRSLPSMVGSLACYLLGLMAKPMLVTFPFTLLLLDVWPLRRVSGVGRSNWPAWTRLFQEKAALFMLSIFFSAFTLLTQFPEGYAHAPVEQPLWGRILFAVEHYRMYVEKFVWPAGMAVFYPRLEMPPDYMSVALSFAILIAITGVALALARRAPALLLGWLWFSGTMFPVVGIVGIGQHSIADRYMYVPMIGLLIGLAWALPEAKRNAARWMFAATGMVLVIACGWMTRTLLPHWQNSEALFRRAIAVTDNNYLMHSNLGRQLLLQGRIDEAIAQFETALAIEPRHVKSINNLGLALSEAGREAEAVPYFEDALRRDPKFIIARINFARTLMNLERYRDALRQYEIIQRAQPASPEAREGIREAREKLRDSATSL